jgi:hypothetical protein
MSIVLSRSCLALDADASLGSGRVTGFWSGSSTNVAGRKACAKENGPEFTLRRMLGWAEERKLQLVHIQAGRPMRNGHVESFHGSLRDEWLNPTWFHTLGDVREKLAADSVAGAGYLRFLIEDPPHLFYRLLILLDRPRFCGGHFCAQLEVLFSWCRTDE